MPYHCPPKAVAAAALLLGILSLAACSDEDAPVRLGLIAGISGGNADFGQAARNGAMLAVEEANRNGGVRGHPVELVIRDDGNDREMATAAAEDLAKQQVTAIVGPFTTAMVEAVLTVTEPKKVLDFSPTASATHFSGKDDHFFRLCSTTTHNAEDYADFMAVRRGYRRVSIALDQTNATFARNFLDAFKTKFLSLGGEIAIEAWHDFRPASGLAELAHRLLEPKPDAVFFITNAIDVARLAQQVRNLDGAASLVAVEWAGTQQLIELGGKAVEGLEVLQLFNRFGKEEGFLRFWETYLRRFSTAPSFASVMAYEVVLVIVKAAENQKKGQTIKEAILANGPYEGLQQTFTIDGYGDSRRKTHFVVINGAEFALAQ